MLVINVNTNLDIILRNFNMIHENLATVRKIINPNASAFARGFGTSFIVYNRYEKGERKPPTELLEYLAREHNVNLHWLFTGEGEMFIAKPPTGKPSKVSVEAKLEGWDQNIANFMADNHLIAEEVSAQTGISAERLSKMPFTKKQLPELKDIIGMLNYDISLDEIFLNKSAENAAIEAELAEIEARARELKGKLR